VGGRLTVKIACSLIAITMLRPAGVALSQTSDPLDDLFVRGRAAQATTKSLSAAFTETSVSSLLRDPLVSTGTLVATLPIRVVMSYSSPTVRTVALDDTRLVVARSPGQAREEINIADTQRRVQKYFGEASSTQLRDLFTITLSSDLKVDAYKLEMVPRRRQIAEGIDRLRIWVDRTKLLMTKMMLDFPGGDSKTLELHDIRTNVAIDESAFALLARKRLP
jgi:outer membrane lipoprotein-sorting protein